MSKITDFYRGTGPDHVGRYLGDYIGFTPDQLEHVHDYIQWMFPNMEASRFNPHAEVLTYDDIDMFLDNPDMAETARAMANHMYRWYNVNTDWITPGNHNFLRITRILKFLNAIELENPLGLSEGDYFFRMVVGRYAEYPTIIGKETLRFWLDASEYKA